MKKICFVAITLCLSLFLTSCFGYSYSSSNLKSMASKIKSISDEINKIDELSTAHLELADYLLAECENNYEQLESLYGTDYANIIYGSIVEIDSFLQGMSDGWYLCDIQTDLEDLQYSLPSHFFE